MASGKIEVLTLGQTGVIIDLNPLEPTLPNDALAVAQNVQHDPQAGAGGALRKRPGQRQFNLIYAGGAILGGIPMSVAGTGGAPTHGGGGDSGGGDGGGDGTGGGGGDNGGGGGGGGTDPGGTGGGAFGSNTGIILGIDTNNAANGYGFLVSPAKGVSAAAATILPFAPGMAGNTGFTVGIYGRPSVGTDDGWFYFAGSKNQDSTAGLSQNIYRTNGTVTQLVTAIAAYDGVNNRYPVVTAMCYAASTKKVYVAIRDTLYNVTTAPAPQSRVFEIDHTSLAVSTVGLIAGYTVMGMVWSEYVSKLYVPTCDHLSVAGGAGAPIYYWSPALGYGNMTASSAITSNSYTTYATEYTDDAGAYLRIGELRVSSGSGYNAAGTVRLSRDAADGISSYGETTDLLTNFAGHFAESMSANAGLYSNALFKGDRYHSWYNSGTKGAIVREILVNTVNDGTRAMGIPTDVWTDSGVGSRMPFELFVVNDVLYAIGSTGSGGNKKVLYTLDGTTWTDISTNFFTNMPATGYPLPTIHWHIDS